MEKNLTNIVNCSDKICASLECNGRRLASVNGTGFSSLEAVKRVLMDLAGRFVGMAVLNVRNCTQGWRNVTALALMRCNASSTAAHPAPHQGGQYGIP